MSERWMTMVPSDQFEREKLRADAAEAEAARLREERHAARVFNEPGVGEVDHSDEVARLRRELEDKHGMMRAAIENAEAAEARCARLQQALRDSGSLATAIRIGWQDGIPRDVETGLRRIEALAGPDTPADKGRA